MTVFLWIIGTLAALSIAAVVGWLVLVYLAFKE